jgi:CRISPR-associated protein Csm5
MTRYRVILRTLSEIHIGDGQTLLREYDFTVHEGRFYRLSVSRLLQGYAEAELTPSVLERLTRLPPGRWLSPEDFRRKEWFLYALEGDPKVGAVRSFIKDVHGRPYLPGSSLKGALRTAILWRIWRERREPIRLSQLGRQREWAAQPLERRWLGSDPHHDLLRALRPGDTGPLPPEEALVVVRAVVQVGPRQAAPLALEALRPGMTLEGRLTMDEGLLAVGAAELGWEGKERYVRGLAAVARDFALDRVRKEAAWARAAGLTALEAFYGDLERRLRRMREEKADAFLLRVGWGGGWESKTLGREPFEDAEFEELLRRYIRPKGRRRPGDPFPRSRRVVVDERDRPIRPFGWVEVRLERES